MFAFLLVAVYGFQFEKDFRLCLHGTAKLEQIRELKEYFFDFNVKFFVNSRELALYLIKHVIVFIHD